MIDNFFKPEKGNVSELHITRRVVIRVNPLPSSTLFYTSLFTITICGENGDERKCDNNSNGEKDISGSGSSKIEVRCFSCSSSATRCLSSNDAVSCNNNDVLLFFPKRLLLFLS